MQKGNSFTIKTSLLTIVTILVIGVLTFAGLGAVAAFRERVHDEKIIRMNELSDLLLTSASNWAVERGITNAALGAAEPVAAESRDQILQRRSVADEALAEALKQLGQEPMFANQGPPIAALENAFTSLKQIRESIDLALQQTRDQRNRGLGSTWVSTATNLILKSRDLRVALTRSQGVDSLIGRLTNLKHFAWVMSEFAGRERAIIGQFIAKGARLDQETLETLNAYRGQVVLAGETVDDISSDEDLPSAVVEAISRASSGYFGGFQQTREAVYDGGVNRVAYPLTSDEWVLKATTAIDSILSLQRSITSVWSESGVALGANRLTENLISAAGNWAVERGATNAALKADLPVSAEARDIIDKRRSEADKAFRAALSQLTRSWTFDDQSEAMQDVEAAYEAAKGLRARADAEIAKGKGERDPALAGLWVPAMTKLITSSQALRVAATRTIAAEDSRVAAFLAAKHNAWAMNEFAGRERAIVAGVIASGERFTDQQLRALSEYRGWVESAWAEIVEFERSPIASSQVKQTIAQVKDLFFIAHEETRTGVYGAEAKGAAYPLSGPEWIAAATRAIDGLLAVEHAAGEATAEIAKSAHSKATRTLLIDAVILALAVLMAGVCLWIIVKRVVGPLRGMTLAMEQISQGNLSIDVPSAGRQDEIGQMASALQIFKDNLQDTERLREQQREQEERSAEESAKAMMELADFFENTVKGVVDGVAGTAADVKTTAESLAGTAHETSERSTTVAAASEEATTNVKTVATATNELSGSISEISQRVSESSAISSSAVAKAGRTNEEVSQLAEAADRIGNVVELISDIAEQTNLLALNATIEAARAGEAGKGFAVVAHEVKSLANQTAQATEDIGRQVTEIQSATGKAVESIQEIATTIGEVNEIATGIAAAVEEQGSATEEISRSVGEAAAGTQDVTQNITAVSQAASEAGQSAGEMLNAADSLADRAAQLGEEVNGFLVRIRESAMGNRRTYERYEGSWRATGDKATSAHACLMKDLSLGGACLDTEEHLPVGKELQLSIEGIDLVIPATVVGKSAKCTHVQFAESDEIHAAVQGFLDRELSQAA